jgi:hypothetical protein
VEGIVQLLISYGRLDVEALFHVIDDRCQQLPKRFAVSFYRKPKRRGFQFQSHFAEFAYLLCVRLKYQAAALGQDRDEPPGLYLVYPQGNFIRASEDTPYLQIGENKYGKPMLDRLVRPELTLDQAIRLCVLSLTATIKSNVSVGPPLDLGIYRANSFQPLTTGRSSASDAYYENITRAWNDASRDAFLELPDFQWPMVAHAPLEMAKP